MVPRFCILFSLNSFWVVVHKLLLTHGWYSCPLKTLKCLYFSVCFSPTTKDIAEYWEHNPDLAADLCEYWGTPGSSMQKVFPIRFYGDGAETIGLNSFELLTMISVAPKHSSTLKTRFVLLGSFCLCPPNAFMESSSIDLVALSLRWFYQGFCFTIMKLWPRLSLRNVVYTQDSDRTKLLKMLVWSFKALCDLDLHQTHIGCNNVFQTQMHLHLYGVWAHHCPTNTWLPNLIFGCAWGINLLDALNPTNLVPIVPEVVLALVSNLFVAANHHCLVPTTWDISCVQKTPG